ncbi:hypothetical protein V9T40_005495 [Parthenolecanium corni]|uniref:Uncharacterized protein n=1 Tax=Parthenolecanium corni TaxID=536013 RepID=A0AAN9TVZ6_9HEMI
MENRMRGKSERRDASVIHTVAIAKEAEAVAERREEKNETKRRRRVESMRKPNRSRTEAEHVSSCSMPTIGEDEMKQFFRPSQHAVCVHERAGNATRRASIAGQRSAVSGQRSAVSGQWSVAVVEKRSQ